MNKSLVLLCAAMTFVAFAPQAAAASTYSGTFAVGEPLAYLFLDACGFPETEGISSNCIDLAPEDVGYGFVLTASDTTGTLVDADVCFYSADAFLNCSEVVPAGATRASVFALGGVEISWTLTIG